MTRVEQFAKQLHPLLLPRTNPPSLSQVRFWFGLSLGFAVLYGVLAWQQAFATPYVVQDDARQHLFWMRQFLDPDLFPNDLIANYFRSIAPLGYTAFYWVPAQLGLDPMVVGKVIPLLLALITTAYSFGIIMGMFPVPVAGFVGCLLLNQNLWYKDDLASGTPRAFLYPLLAAFLYYLLRRSLLPCLGAIALQGLFYPQIVLLSAGVLVLSVVRWHEGRLRLTSDRQEYWFCIAGLGTAFLVLLPFALQSSEFDPVITVAEARSLPEFGDDGRTAFFLPPIEFWLRGQRSGLFPRRLVPPLIWAGFLLPFLWRIPVRLPLLATVTPAVHLLTRLTLASLGWFFLAHLVLFKLHLPSRYTQHSLRLILPMAAAIALVVLLDGLLRGLLAASSQRSRWRTLTAMGVVLAFTGVLLSFPAPDRMNYYSGKAPDLYAFLQQQPKDVLIASLSEETNSIPSLAQRSVLVSREYSIPFHTGYYYQMRQRAMDLITAQYSPDLTQVQNFIRHYGVDLWMLESGWLQPDYLKENKWLMQFQPETEQAIARLERKQPLALKTLRRKCQVWKTPRFTVLDATCITELPSPNSIQYGSL